MDWEISLTVLEGRRKMLSLEEQDLVGRAKSLYESRLKDELETSHLNAFVAIEPDSGRFFLGQTLHDAAEAARAVYPERLTFVMRVGHRTAIHMGAAL